MSSLKPSETRLLQKLFELERGSGYVFDFSDLSFRKFIYQVTSIDIYSPDYETYGNSKGKRLLAFLDRENDQLVGSLLSQLCEYWETLRMGSEVSESELKLYDACKVIADKLVGKKANASEKTEDQFLKQDFGSLSLAPLGLESSLEKVLEHRIAEIQKNLTVGSSLSAIFLCGSILEGILLGVAVRNPKRFNQADCCPKKKDDGKPMAFAEWSLSDLINVAHEVGFIGLDVKKFSHTLRDFRNYIHPYEQWSSKFNPDLHTAEISWRVLQAAINDLVNLSK